MGKRLHGTLLGADRFGNLVTSIPFEAIGDPKHAVVRTGSVQVRAVVPTFGARSAGTLIAYEGSLGLLELAVVRGDQDQSAVQEATVFQGGDHFANK